VISTPTSSPDQAWSAVKSVEVVKRFELVVGAPRRELVLHGLAPNARTERLIQPRHVDVRTRGAPIEALLEKSQTLAKPEP
jgi:hypothetical protein